MLNPRKTLMGSDEQSYGPILTHEDFLLMAPSDY